MVKKFYDDLEKAKGAENLVRRTLSRLMPDYSFQDVSSEPFYYHRGDIRAVDEFGNEVMIEVKDDSRIADTHNILCEEETLFLDTNQYKKGNFHSKYEVYSIVSKSERKIYFFNFSILKEIYKDYQKKFITHSDQINLVYLVPISAAKQKGALIAAINY